MILQNDKVKPHVNLFMDLCLNAGWANRMLPLLEMMRRKFIPALGRKCGINMNNVIYQQDGAPSHCSNVSLDFLNKHFPGDRLISRRIDNPWPAHSPDLFSSDYFLWGYLNYNNPQTIKALKTNIRQEIWRIPLEVSSNVIANFNVRVAAVILSRGAWIEHVIKY